MILAYPFLAAQRYRSLARGLAVFHLDLLLTFTTPIGQPFAPSLRPPQGYSSFSINL